MDPLTQLPATTEVHIAHAANATPSHGPNHNHPPYAEMITAAITALKEKKGSSRKAIAKYIDRVYTNLPPTHPALLTHHLKRLKTNGQLVMVKHSYKLPRSAASGTATATATATGSALSSAPKRGPGRPPKPKPETQPMLVALGLVDGPVLSKRGRGRPPKTTTGTVVTESNGPVLSKRGPGRTPKPKPMIVPGLPNVPRPRGRPRKGASSSVKVLGRPRGRPPKNVQAAGDGGLSGKRRGRPPKVGGAKKPKTGTGRSVGRPKKNVSRIEASEPAQWVAYEDLKRKLEYFQSRIKQAAVMLKPHLTNESAIGAIVALQELEELATVDISAPLNVEGQESVLIN